MSSGKLSKRKTKRVTYRHEGVIRFVDSGSLLTHYYSVDLKIQTIYLKLS
jgi:hypothetical protein